MYLLVPSAAESSIFCIWTPMLSQEHSCWMYLSGFQLCQCGDFQLHCFPMTSHIWYFHCFVPSWIVWGISRGFQHAILFSLLPQHVDYLLLQILNCFKSHLHSFPPPHFHSWFDLKYSVPVPHLPSNWMFQTKAKYHVWQQCQIFAFITGRNGLIPQNRRK